MARLGVSLSVRYSVLVDVIAVVMQATQATFTHLLLLRKEVFPPSVMNRIKHSIDHSMALRLTRQLNAIKLKLVGEGVRCCRGVFWEKNAL